MVKPCPRCVSRGQPWSGSPPKCAFASGVFDADNWNCATMNALRGLVERTPAVSYVEEQRAAILPMHDRGDYIVISWYKSRGKTELAYIVGTKAPLTLDDAEGVLREAAMLVDAPCRKKKGGRRV